MNKLIKNTIGLVLFILLAANVFVFIHGVKLGDDVNFYEAELKKLQHENIELEKKVYKAESIVQAASIAAELSYTTTSSPMYVGRTQYAYNQ